MYNNNNNNAAEDEGLLEGLPNNINNKTSTTTTTMLSGNHIGEQEDEHGGEDDVKLHNHVDPNLMDKDLEKGSVRLPSTKKTPAHRRFSNRNRQKSTSLSSNHHQLWFKQNKKHPQHNQPKRQPRLVAKNGDCILRPNNLRNSYAICLRNWFHLIIEHSWRRIFSLFISGFLCSWLLFGLLYYLIVQFSGPVVNEPWSLNLSENRQCIANVHSFTSAFLFSLESQHTIGYGTRYMTEGCPLAYAVLSLQCIVGVLLQTILAGIVTAKILRPKKRKQEMRFSLEAVIGPVDDEDPRPALMIRLADIQHRLYIAESHVRLYMATTKINKAGECELIGMQDMNVGYDTGMDRVLLLWPVVIRHIIDQESPLWEITEERLKTCQFELIMTVEGIVEATGMAFQARTSFLPEDIKWGRRFVPMITLNPTSNEFEVNYDLFDVTEPHPVEPWLADDCMMTTDEEGMKLAVISELGNNDGAAQPAVARKLTQPHGHWPNGMVVLEPPRGHYRFRRKSACSVGKSSLDGKTSLDGSALPPSRKTSKGSLLHVLLKRTATTDSSPLVMSGAVARSEEEVQSGDDLAGVLQVAPPASPYILHTLQHSGFT